MMVSLKYFPILSLFSLSVAKPHGHPNHHQGTNIPRHIPLATGSCWSISHDARPEDGSGYGALNDYWAGSTCPVDDDGSVDPLVNTATRIAEAQHTPTGCASAPSSQSGLLYQVRAASLAPEMLVLQP